MRTEPERGGFSAPSARARRRRRALGALAMAGLAVAAWAVRDVPAALGRLPGGARADRVRRSPQFRAGAFRNPVDTRTMVPGTGREMLRDLVLGGQPRRPAGSIPVIVPGAAPPASAPAGELGVIWYGHASALIEIEGRRVLLDPVWSDRCSPSARLGPRRLHPVPVPLDRLPRLDAIVISHDHYDHLDMATVRALRHGQSAPFLVPLGVGAHLERWGVPPHRIVELDWTERATVAGLDFTVAPARHFSGRGLVRDRTLWGSWVISGRHRRVFCSGDSGYFAGYAEIGARYGPFDATLMQIGAYAVAWPNIHMVPEEAITAHLDLRGDLLIPVHWGTFTLAPHAWTDPVDRLWREAKARGVRLAVPRPGERVVVDQPPPVDAWWQALG
ncbi:L-ascorbate metabolism protein UlaG (beta-lactamase superfamily) [Plantactinospora soyae]|uniref:L-ascorbate metabolism protein UlaG (Beta-lactamase superfamily) n=2 Tax=Plantactinospora soyae TaxID=1544732 RepID=A0A927M6N5_9ACTN|nr:L-ascorbate metabolism protein UlaG (beta-lactamase superfamily) [Plantactinospora soyae]